MSSFFNSYQVSTDVLFDRMSTYLVRHQSFASSTKYIVANNEVLSRVENEIIEFLRVSRSIEGSRL